MHVQTTTVPRLWLVDDDQDDQLLVYSAFEQRVPPIYLKILNDGDEVVPELTRTQKLPRLILLDINMPRQNGFETLKQLRQLPACKDLPVIIFSTSSAENDRAKALALGATRFLTKPTSYTNLKALINQLVQDWQLNN